MFENVQKSSFSWRQPVGHVVFLLLPVHFLVPLGLAFVFPGVLEDFNVAPVGFVEVGSNVVFGLFLLLLALLAKVEMVILAIEFGVLEK